MSEMPPKDWPRHLPFSSVSHTEELPMDLLRLLMFASMDSSVASPLFDKKEVHANLSIRNLSHFVPQHPLAHRKTVIGNEQHGVFAEEEIGEREILGEYVGRIYYFPSKAKGRTAFSEYKWTITHPHYTLVIDPQYGANALALINDYRGIAKEPNVIPSLISHKGYRYFSYLTRRKILVGEELLVDYGTDFWFN